MIISHSHRYVFVELPRTGSTTISRELVQHYAGKRILRKHSSYYDFLKTAGREEKEYFVFSSIRNPLDDAVSHYFKLRTNHAERYTNPVKLKKRTTLAERLDNYYYRQIASDDIDFETFFLRFYRISYNNWASLGRKHYDFVIRFENIQQDFAAALHLMGIEPVRPLPVRNATSNRKKEFHEYYTPTARARAQRIFGPFMQEWGYQFPAGWGERQISWHHQLEYQFINFFRLVYWRYLRVRI